MDRSPGASPIELFPADDWPAGWDGGVSAYVSLADGELNWARVTIGWLDTVLATAAEATGGSSFAAQRRICLRGCSSTSAQPRRRGKHTPIGLETVGFRAVLSCVTPVERDLIEGLRPDQPRAGYDAIVIGSGPGDGSPPKRSLPQARPCCSSNAVPLCRTLRRAAR